MLKTLSLATLATAVVFTPAVLAIDRAFYRATHHPWLMVTWVAIGSGSQTSTTATERQCKAMVAVINASNDPMVVYCLGPHGERVETIALIERLRKMPPQAFTRPTAPFPPKPPVTDM